LDYSGSSDFIPRISNRVKHITLIDHHKTAFEMIDLWKKEDSIPSNCMYINIYIFLLFIITLFIMLFIINAYINITLNLMHELGIFPTVTSLGIYFLGGALMHYIKIQQINYRWLLILAIACLLCVKFSFWYMIFYIFWPIVIIGIGLASFPVINQVDKYVGDISYGIYLYAFPVQQALIALELVEQPIHLIWLSLLITSVLAKVSWEYVEKPFLKFKSKQLIQIK